jgi:hypothetical protein
MSPCPESSCHTRCFSGVREMRDTRECLLSTPNCSTPVKDLPYCVYCGKMYRYEGFNVECHMDPNIGKSTLKGRTVPPYRESIPTSRGPHRKRFFGSVVRNPRTDDERQKDYVSRSSCVTKTQHSILNPSRSWTKQSTQICTCS